MSFCIKFQSYREDIHEIVGEPRLGGCDSCTVDPDNFTSSSGFRISLSSYLDPSLPIIVYAGAKGDTMVVPQGYNYAVYIDSSGNVTHEQVSTGQTLTFRSDIALGSVPIGLSIRLSNDQVEELSPAGTQVGMLTTDRASGGVFALHSSHSDNNKFYIQENALMLNSTLAYTPGVDYKITVKYTIYKYEKIQDFTIKVVRASENKTAQVGENVRVQSGSDGSDKNVSVVFGKVTSPGDVFFNQAELNQEMKSVFYSIETNAGFEGGINICFKNSDIHTYNNPKIIRLRYDSQSDSTLYEDITTSISEGEICAVINSPVGLRALAGGEPSIFNLWGVFDPIPPEAWAGGGGGPGGCEADAGIVADPAGCPGNQTKGNFSLSEQGVGLPRLLGGTCGCWLSSAITVDMFLGVGALASAARTAACGLTKSIWNLAQLIKTLDGEILQLKNLIIPLRNSANLLKTKVDDLTAQLSKLADDISSRTANIKAFTEQIQKWYLDIVNLCGGDATQQGCIKLLQLEDEIKNLGDEIFKSAAISGQTPDEFIKANPLDQNVINYLNKQTELDQGIEQLNNLKDLIAGRGLDLAQAEADLADDILKEALAKAERKTAGEELLNKEFELANQENLLAQKEAIHTQSVAEKVSKESSLFQHGQDLALNLWLLYGYLNEISIQKVCEGANETLNYYSCECCQPCPNIKVHPVGQSGIGLHPSLVGKVISCDCVCPAGKESCVSAGVENCYDPCPTGRIRAGANCDCVCLNGPSDCSPNETFNSATCACESSSSSSGSDPCNPGNCCYCAYWKADYTGSITGPKSPTCDAEDYGPWCYANRPLGMPWSGASLAVFNCCDGQCLTKQEMIRLPDGGLEPYPEC